MSNSKATVIPFPQPAPDPAAQSARIQAGLEVVRRYHDSIARIEQDVERFGYADPDVYKRVCTGAYNRFMAEMVRLGWSSVAQFNDALEAAGMDPVIDTEKEGMEGTVPTSH